MRTGPSDDLGLRPEVVLGNPEPDPESVARTICLNQLSRGPRTRHQLAQVLARRQVPDGAASAVLDRFTEVGLIDDAAFASAWVESRQASRGLSRRSLSQELRTKGVAAEAISEALDQVSPDDEWAAAETLVARKLPATRRLPREVRMRRLVGMLARKGYGHGLALSVVSAALERDALDE